MNFVDGKYPNNVKLARANRKMSMEKLCKRSGISMSSLSIIENGHRKSKIETFKKLADALDYDLGAIISVDWRDLADGDQRKTSKNSN